MRLLIMLHDSSSRLAFGGAGLALVLATGLYVFEVVARYIFDSPTTWSGEFVRYSLAFVIFLALPEVTRRKRHVAIEIIFELLGARSKRKLVALTDFVGSLVCLSVGFICASQAHIQFEREILTNAVHPIPRYWLTAAIAFGLMSAGLHFMRNMISGGDRT